MNGGNSKAFGTMICMSNVPDKKSPHLRKLTAPLSCKKMDGTIGLVPPGFEWDGSSVPWVFQGLFPRHRHPVASCRHDWRCHNAENKAERAFADMEFEKDVGKTSWWVTKKVMYAGVRIGAYLGIGVYKD